MSTMVNVLIYNVDHSQSSVMCVDCIKVDVCNIDRGQSYDMQCQLWLKSLYAMSTIVKVWLRNIDCGQSWCMQY